MSEPCKIVRNNTSKYLKSPTIEDIQSALDNLGVCARHFERYFGIPVKTITKFKVGSQGFPKKYWHLIFENLPKDKQEVLKTITKPVAPKPKIKRAKKKRVVMDDKILALL